jgi:hypothetical protein
MSEVTWLIGRVKLYELWQEKPQQKHKDLAQEVGFSTSWVDKWVKRYEEADPESDDIILFLSQSRARHTSNQKIEPVVEEAILEIRDNPPENLGRVPGPEAILYYLHRNEDLLAAGHYLPRSTSTIWKILDQHQRIYRYQRPKPQPEEPAEPMEEWQIDFKSVSSVPPEEGGKKQHVVETLNVVDKGTSILVEATPRDDFNAETALIAMVDVFSQHGLPRAVRFDRDPRFVASWTMNEFPSAWMRFLQVLDIIPLVCPPHRPDKNPHVERYHLNYDRECLARERPDTLSKTITCTDTYLKHYNEERPNQARSCQNQPPRIAFPDAKTDRRLPHTIDPDHWLVAASRRMYRRRVTNNGSIQIGGHRYFIRRDLAKQEVALRLDPQEKQFQVFDGQTLIKTMPLKGLYHGRMETADYIGYICQEAVSEARRLAAHRRKKRRKRLKH